MAVPGGVEPDTSEMAFRFLAGRPSLDLCATIGERWKRSFDRLQGPADLARWIAASGLTSTSVRPNNTDLTAARELRAVTLAGAARIMGGAPLRAPDARRLSQFAAAMPLRPRLQGGQVRWEAPDGAASVLSTIAADAIDLFAGPLHGRIRECASPTCSLLFVDTSRPGRRQWCSSETCGGQARARAYRRRNADRGTTV
jgi:predicted RNA-binding Zn ribbon-like protein